MGCCKAVPGGKKQEGLNPLLLAGKVPTLKEFVLQRVVAVAQELPEVAGGVMDVTHTWKFPSAPFVSTDTHTWVPGVNVQFTDAVPPPVALALQVLYVPLAQPVLSIVTTTCCAAGDPVGVTVTVFCEPVAMKVYHTSSPGVPVSHVLVVRSLVAPTFVPVTQALPDDGIDITVAVLHASFATCAFDAKENRRGIPARSSFNLGEFKMLFILSLDYSLTCSICFIG